MSQTPESYLLDIIRDSFLQAKALPDEGTSDQIRHHNRSRNWVDCLAKRFKSEFTDNDIRVFSKHDDCNRTQFGLNELLYDVVVCRLGYTHAAVHNKEIPYVKEAIWQVESEFANNTREIVIDFSKLIMGSASHKLFIAAASKNCDKILRALIPVANDCSGRIFIAFIPHPKNWKDHADSDLLLLKFTDGDWVNL